MSDITKMKLKTFLMF